jgi:hypothetical protein
MVARREILDHMRANRRPRNRCVPLGLGVIAFLALALGAAAQADAALPGAANGNIAFVSDRDPLGTGNAQVFVMGPQGENPTNLSTDNSNEVGPTFSPDGSRIAFDWSPEYWRVRSRWPERPATRAVQAKQRQRRPPFHAAS